MPWWPIESWRDVSTVGFMIEGSTSCCSTPKHGSLTSRYNTPDIILNLLNCLIKTFTAVGWSFDVGLRGHASSIISMSASSCCIRDNVCGDCSCRLHVAQLVVWISFCSQKVSCIHAMCDGTSVDLLLSGISSLALTGCLDNASAGLTFPGRYTMSKSN